MIIRAIKSLWPEKEDFSVYRSNVGNQYIFVHMLSEGELIVDGKWRKAEKGACIISAPFSAQGVRACGTSVLHDWLHLEGKDVASILAKYGIRTGEISYPAKDSFVTHDIREAELAALSSSPYAKELSALLIEVMFAHLAGALAAETPKESPYLYRRFTELRSEILLRYDTPLSVSEMAQSLSLSPSRFHRLYKNYFGVSPAQDVQNTRIEHAKLLLLQKNLSVTEAAERLGYSNVYHFIRQFKEKVGSTPGEYRRTMYATDEYGFPL